MTDITYRQFIFAFLLASAGPLAAADLWPAGLHCQRELAERPLTLAEAGQAVTDILWGVDSPLVRGPANWISGFVQRTTGATVAVRPLEGRPTAGPHVVALVGDQHPWLRELAAAGRFEMDPRVGGQGYVIRRLRDPQWGDTLVCWSPAEIGCRYGLIEILRSLRVEGKTVSCSLGHVVERPTFPVRICYVNFAEHLQNAFNPNVLFDVPVNRWSDAQWERFIDMISAFRYNVFEFWLVPTLFSEDALEGGKIPTQFAETMNRVIAYAKSQGVDVHPIQAVNTIGASWYYACPNDPADHARIVALWDHWSKSLPGLRSIGFFPGDPGGCYRNGCTAETFVDLCLELSQIVRRNQPELAVEVGTWGEPMGGWGVPLWQGKPERAAQAMKYLLAKLPQFPPGTFTSINLGFSPDCLPTHGGDGKPYAIEAAKTRPVLTWDYSVTEGEGTVIPHCRVRRMFERRREERAVGCYSGGICYTMAPKLNCASLFCCAESFWNPELEPDQVLADYGRLVFGEQQAEAGPLLEEFEVIPDWGYYAPFEYSPQRLEEKMSRLLSLLDEIPADAQSRLPLAPTMAEYRESLDFFAQLFRQLAAVATRVEEINALAREAGLVPRERPEPVSLDELESLLADRPDFPQRARLQAVSGELRRADVRALTKRYWDTVYGIYDQVAHPTDPRAQGATAVLFRRFRCEYAVMHEPCLLEKTLAASGKPYVLVDLGLPIRERGWKLSGWTLQGEDAGETWRASFDEPGIIARDDFADRGYRWLVVHLTEGPAGGRKTIAVNGQVVGEFIRTGPSVSVKKEWWVTRSFPIPAGLLKNGPLEIRFTDPGIAISAVALAAERLEDTK